jgi:ubiquinone/menaquinone biosynthesis C-methylase UbiE
MAHQQADHVCPPWIGYFLLANPLRRLLYTPKSILGPYISEGMTVLEPGPGMGFFTLEAAHMVGPTGRVIAVDIQMKMLEVLRRRAQRAGLLDRLDVRLIENNDLGIKDLKGKVDFVLAFAMVHEVPDAQEFFSQISVVLKTGGRMLFSEPSGHVSEEHFAKSLAVVQDAGLPIESRPVIRMSRSALAVKV